MAKKSASSKPRNKKSLQGLKLGEANTHYNSDYAPETLEAIDNKNPNSGAWVSFLCTEFTSLCPKTNQPDFARVYINYVPHKKLVESKALKLYLFSFRNHGDFHEDCIQTICDDIVNLIRPCYLEVIGEFTPRGGIAIFPYSQYSNSNAKYKALKKRRFEEYSPGRFSIPLQRMY